MTSPDASALPPFGGATCRKCGVDHGRVSGEFDSEEYGGDGTGLQATHCKGGPSWFGCRVAGEHLHRWCPTCQAEYLERVREDGEGIHLAPAEGTPSPARDRGEAPRARGRDPLIPLLVAVVVVAGMACRVLLELVSR